MNADGGILARELPVRGGRLAADGQRRWPAHVNALLVPDGAVEAVTGWHISAVRNAVAPRIAGRAPYVYTSALRGRRTPARRVPHRRDPRSAGPSCPPLAARRTRRTVLGRVGDDYVWPRATARVTRRYAATMGAEIALETFVPLGTTDSPRPSVAIEARGCDLVLMLLVGDDAVNFNRQFAARGLDGACLRFSPLMEENMLLATGADNTRDLYSAAGFFEALASAYCQDFGRRYTSRFGAEAPVLNSLGESCYEGVRLLTALMGRAGSAEVPSMTSVSEGLSYESPRGTVELRDRHLRQRVFLAVADGLSWDVIQQL